MSRKKKIEKPEAKQESTLEETSWTTTDIDGGGHSWWYVCTECRYVLDWHCEICPNCKRRVNWNG